LNLERRSPSRSLFGEPSFFSLTGGLLSHGGRLLSGVTRCFGFVGSLALSPASISGVADCLLRCLSLQ
jgi:hypothetical protein